MNRGQELKEEINDIRHLFDELKSEGLEDNESKECYKNILLTKMRLESELKGYQEAEQEILKTMNNIKTKEIKKLEKLETKLKLNEKKFILKLLKSQKMLKKILKKKK